MIRSFRSTLLRTRAGWRMGDSCGSHYTRLFVMAHINSASQCHCHCIDYVPTRFWQLIKLGSWECSRKQKKKMVLTLQELSIFPEDRSKYTNTKNELSLPFKFANVKYCL